MKPTRCKDWMPEDFVEDLMTFLAKGTARHDAREHGKNVHCMDAKIELAAMIIHAFQIGPEELELVSERLEDKQRACPCPMCTKSRKD